MESAIQIFDYINDGEFALIYEGKTKLIGEDIKYEEISELLELLFVKDNLSIPDKLDGVLIINNDLKLGVKHIDGKITIDKLDSDNLEVFTEWYGDNNKLSDNKKSLQEAIKILEVINKSELSYAVEVLMIELERS